MCLLLCGMVVLGGPCLARAGMRWLYHVLVLVSGLVFLSSTKLRIPSATMSGYQSSCGEERARQHHVRLIKHHVDTMHECMVKELFLKFLRVSCMHACIQGFRERCRPRLTRPGVCSMWCSQVRAISISMKSALTPGEQTGLCNRSLTFPSGETNIVSFFRTFNLTALSTRQPIWCSSCKR